MSITVETEIDLECCKCGRSIQDEYTVICEDCAALPDDELKEILENILPYVNEATVLAPVMIPGDLAFRLREKLRSILNEGK